MHRIATAAIVLLLAACAYSTKGSRAPGAPALPPSAYADLVREVPEGAQLVGTVRAQGNNWQSPADCDAQLLVEARKLGANAVLAVPEKSGLGNGPKCSGTAYLIGKP